jgi:HEAT repeat protein
MRKPSSVRKYIDKVLYNESIPGRSDLRHLSAMSDDDLAIFKHEWEKIDKLRRQAIISQLVFLCETDYKLDFSSVFRYCLEDPDPGIRSHAIIGLSEEEDELSISPLIRFTQSVNDEEVRVAAVKALGKFAILGELGKLSTTQKEYLYNTLLSLLKDNEESDDIKSKALVTIAAFHVPEVKALIEEAYSSGEILYKISAIRAMGRNCDLMWLDTLLKEIYSDDIDIRYEAILACGELNAEETIPVLIKLTGNSNVRIREAAIKSLGEIGGENARKTLTGLVNNSRGRTRKAAIAAVKELDICEDFLSMNY